jgi:hypothetical protein
MRQVSSVPGEIGKRQQAIAVGEGQSFWRLATEHNDLLAKNQDIRFTPCAPEQPNERDAKPI